GRASVGPPPRRRRRARRPRDHHRPGRRQRRGRRRRSTVNDEHRHPDDDSRHPDDDPAAPGDETGEQTGESGTPAEGTTVLVRRGRRPILGFWVVLSVLVPAVAGLVLGPFLGLRDVGDIVIFALLLVLAAGFPLA